MKTIFKTGNWKLVKLQTGVKLMGTFKSKPDVVDWPVRYKNGKIGFDYPEQNPKTIKDRVKKATW